MYRLVELSINDGRDIYDMLQHIEANENEFKNAVKGMSYVEYEKWLEEQAYWAEGRNLPPGFVQQTIFWLFIGETPVGIGKIRHDLTEQSRLVGGNIGYAISSNCRGNGYATILLKMLIEKAKELEVKERILTVEKYNPASKKVIEKCGGILFAETMERWYFKL